MGGNSVDLDKMLHSAVSDLGLHCLSRPVCCNTYNMVELQLNRFLVENMKQILKSILIASNSTKMIATL